MKRVHIAVGVAAVVLIAAIVPGLTRKEQFAQPVQDAVVEVQKPDTGNIYVKSAVVGTISSEEYASVSLKAGGDVTEVYIKAGDHVEAGDKLFDIDTKQVDSAKNNLDTAELNLSKAQDELSRQKVLYDGGGISEQAYKQYQDNVTSAKIAYDSAKTNYDNQVSYSNVTAPISGTVEVVNIEKLDTVQQGTAACVISGGGAKTVEFSVSEKVAKNIAAGDEMSVEKDGNEYEGHIYEVSSMADSQTGLFKVKAKLSETEDDSALPTGSSVKLYVITEKAEDVMRVPVDAVYYDGGLSYVYTYDAAESCLHKVQVETGTYDSEYIEIKSGITKDDEVLITWSAELYEGVKVRLKGSTDTALGSVENAPAQGGDADMRKNENAEARTQAADTAEASEKDAQ